jgi:CBS domain-containing protein
MFVELGTPLGDAKELMHENGVHSVAVIDHEGHLVGFIA